MSRTRDLDQRPRESGWPGRRMRDMRYWYGKRDHVTIPSTPSDKGSAWRAAETSSSSTATTNGQRDPNCRNCRARHLDALRSCPDPPVMNMQWDCSTAPLPFVGISCGGLQRGAGSRLGMPISIDAVDSGLESLSIAVKQRPRSRCRCQARCREKKEKLRRGCAVDNCTPDGELGA